MAEKYIPGDHKEEGMVESQPRWAATVLHELGHSYDRNSKLISETQAFAELFNQDAAAMNANQQQRFAKDIERAKQGKRGEVFANLFMDLICQQANFKPPRPDIARAFPRSLAFVQKYLASH